MPRAIARASRRGVRISRCARRAKASSASRATATRRARAPRSPPRSSRARRRCWPRARVAWACGSMARSHGKSFAAPRNPCPPRGRKWARGCSTAPRRSTRCARGINAPPRRLTDTRSNMPDKHHRPSNGRRYEAAQRQKALKAMRPLANDDAALLSLLKEWARGGDDAVTPETLRTALYMLLRKAIGRKGFELTTEQLPQLRAALARQDNKSIRSHVRPALRLVIFAKPRDEDIHKLNAWLNHILKENSMNFDFFIDTSSIPILQVQKTLDDFNKRVNDDLKSRFRLPDTDAHVESVPLAAAIEGTVVLDGEADPASSGLPDAIRRAWLESLADVP